MPAVSVCMATYNGAEYVGQQVESILQELQGGDELVVVDDCSTDETVAMIRVLSDHRIRIVTNPRNVGPNQSFAEAIALSTRPIIMLSDQDDVWVSGRRAILVDALATSGKMLVSSNQDCMDRDGRTMQCGLPRISGRDSCAHWKNVFSMYTGRCAYYGCAMAFRRELLSMILPVPAYVESHDLWIAMAANILGTNFHVEDVTLRRRLHGSNASLRRRRLGQKLWSRVVHTASLVQLLGRSTRLKFEAVRRYS